MREVKQQLKVACTSPKQTATLINEHKPAAHTCARLQNLISTYLKDVNHD